MKRAFAVLAVVCGCVGVVRAGDEEEVQKRIDVLKDEDKSMRSKREAVSELRKFGAKAESALPVLKEFLFKPQTADAVISTLGQMGAKGVPMLLEVVDMPFPVKVPLPRGLTDKEVSEAHQALRNWLYWKRLAVDTLGGMGPDAASAVKPLLAGIATPEIELPGAGNTYDLRRGALIALARIAGEDDAKAVATALGGFLKDTRYASGALDGLRQMGARAKDATPAMIAMIERFLKQEKTAVPSSEVSVAVHIFQSIGPDAADALPVLRTLLKTGQFDYAEKAIEAIKAKK